MATRIIATTAFMIEDMNQFSSPYPEIEIGPKIVTTIAPPTSIRIHIPNKNPYRPGFILKPPS